MEDERQDTSLEKEYNFLKETEERSRHELLKAENRVESVTIKLEEIKNV